MSVCDFEERCNAASTPNDMKILLKEIKLNVKKLMETTEAKLLLHDGKIAELCKYLKGNLENTIRCILKDMELTGNLDEIINSTLNDFYEEYIVARNAVGVRFVPLTRKRKCSI